MGRPGLRVHPKFVRLLHILQEPESHIRGYLECLWEVSYESGNPVIGDLTDLQLAMKYPMQNMQKMQNVADAFLHCGGKNRAGFIELNDDGDYQVHDLFDHAPDYVQKRMGREFEREAKGLTLSEVRSRAARARWDKRKTDLSDSADSVGQEKSGKNGDACKISSFVDAKASNGDFASTKKRHSTSLEVAKHANGMQVNPFASRQDANVRTPAPAPAPAPHLNSIPPNPLEGEIWDSFPEGCGPSSIPESINTPEMIEVLADFAKYLRETNGKLLSTSWRKQLQHMGKLGLDKTTEAIEYTIRQGYKGLIEPGKNGAAKQVERAAFDPCPEQTVMP